MNPADTASLDTTPFLVNAAAQAAAALVITAVLLLFQRQYARSYLLHWGWSWAALCASVTAGSLGPALGLVSIAWPPAAALSVAAWNLYVLLSVLGAYGRVTGREIPRPMAWVVLLAAAAAGVVVAGVSSASSGPRMAGALLAAGGFALAGTVLLRARGERATAGARMVGGAFLLYAVRYAAGLLDPAPASLRGFDLDNTLIQALAGFGMMVCLLEEERGSAASAAALIEHQAFHDDLTGLPNRRLFMDRLQLALVQAHRDQTTAAVLFLDLDRFKVINESLGHSRGEELLRSVAARLQATVREGDTVARLGGDEFILLLPRVGQPSDAARIALKLVDAVRAPFVLDGEELFITTSIGVALFPEDGSDAETLVKNCDIAMYRAKEHGRDTFQLYTSGMNPQAVQRLNLENSLHKVLAREELVLHYQPLVDMASGLVHGSEALLRWQHPERGLLYPRDFMDLAEQTGLITPIGAWVLDTACTQTRAWQERGHPELSIAVNLSARQFLQPDLARQVRSALARSGLDARYLELEITESLAMHKADATIDTLRELKGLGVRISIDDFGTGYSSLSYLKRFPIDTLKIDQSFVSEIHADPGDAAIATTVIAMARTLGLRVVAEGVEREEQFSFLRDQKCDQVQGFLFSRPVGAADFEVLLGGGRLGPAPPPVGLGPAGLLPPRPTV